MIDLVFVPLVGFWVWMCWVVSRPKANYVGTPPSKFAIAARVMARGARLMIGGLGLLQGAMRGAVEAQLQLQETMARFRLSLEASPSDFVGRLFR